MPPRTARINAQPLYYATYVSKTEVLGEYSNPTGTYKITYSSPVAVSWNVGTVDSDAEVEMFGISSMEVIRIIPVSDVLDEASIIWFGKEPPSPYVATNPAHNYRVVGIRRTLNTVTVYAQKVDVSYAAVVTEEPEPEEPPPVEPPIEPPVEGDEE